MAGKDKKEDKLKPVKKEKLLTLYEMEAETGESSPIIMGALVNGGLQKEVNKAQSKTIAKGYKPIGIITKSELITMIKDFKNKEV